MRKPFDPAGAARGINKLQAAGRGVAATRLQNKLNRFNARQAPPAAPGMQAPMATPADPQMSIPGGGGGFADIFGGITGDRQQSGEMFRGAPVRTAPLPGRTPNLQVPQRPEIRDTGFIDGRDGQMAGAAPGGGIMNQGMVDNAARLFGQTGSLQQVRKPSWLEMLGRGFK